jgi:predicted RNA-binding Zn-ribbon protein involved in translation (DUF1610 family)
MSTARYLSAFTCPDCGYYFLERSAECIKNAEGKSTILCQKCEIELVEVDRMKAKLLGPEIYGFYAIIEE